MNFNLEEAYNPPFKNLGQLVSSLLNNIFYLAGFLLIILFLAAGYSFMMAAGKGESNSFEKGKKTLTAALLGFAIIIASYFLVQLIELITGVNILQKP